MRRSVRTMRVNSPFKADTYRRPCGVISFLTADSHLTVKVVQQPTQNCELIHALQRQKQKRNPKVVWEELRRQHSRQRTTTP